MKMLKLTLCLVLTLCGAALAKAKRIDVCSVSKKLYDNGGRDVACGGGQQAHQSLCDSERPAGWYKVLANSDTDPVYKPVDMPTVCPEIGQCGATNPLWLNGSLPSVSEDVVQMSVCMAGKSGCCEKSFPIYVLNCTSFYSYFLDKTPDCSTRYCFGNSSECPHRNQPSKPGEGMHGVKDATTRAYWETTTSWYRTSQPWRNRTTRPYWERTTRPYWETTTRSWWDWTTKPWWGRTTRPWWDRTTQPWWDRTTQPWWDRTTQPWWDRTTQPWWDRTTRPWWDRTTQPWWDRTTRPWWDRTTQPWWDRTTQPWWDRTTQPWWYSTTYEPRPEYNWERRYRHLLHLTRRNIILSSVTLLLVAITVISVVAMALCKTCRKKRRSKYDLFQTAHINEIIKA